jgi:hypothetical protein
LKEITQIKFLLCSAGALLSMMSARAETEAVDWQFTDVTKEVVDKNPPGTGIVFDYAFIDLNDDNYLDIVTNNHHQSKGSPIWLGTADYKFKFWQNMPEAWLPIAGFHLGEVDHDGDGKTDLICTGNEGGVVVNINTTAAGSNEPSFESIQIHSSSHLVSFIDFDGDGKLETLVRPSQIFKDLKEKALKSGIHMGTWTVADFNSDGWPDLFAAGIQSRRSYWSGPRKLYRNNKGVLEEAATDSALVTGYIGGIAKSADFNNDGHFDIYIFSSTNIEEDKTERITYPMKLFLGDGQMGFKDVSEKAGLTASKQKSGYSHVYIADIDNDTDLDLINQGNYGTYGWKNNGDGTFSMLAKSITSGWASSSHLRLDDFDMDGRLDIVTAAPGAKWKDREESIRVFRNTNQNGNNWLKVQLRQTGGNTMCIGAIVTVFATGTKTILGKRMLYSDTEGYHPRLHFGLAKHEKVDVEVLFPTSKETTLFKELAANRYVVLVPAGTVADVKFGNKW